MATKIKKSKRFIKQEEKITKSLNPNQILFCQLYSFDKECFGNATLSYMRAYNLKESQRKNARHHGYRLATNEHILDYRNLLLATRFNNESVDDRHSELMHQNKNLVVAMQAVQEFNKVKKRVEDAPISHITFAWKGDNRPKKTGNISKSEIPVDTKKTPKGKFVIEVNNG